MQIRTAFLCSESPRGFSPALIVTDVPALWTDCTQMMNTWGVDPEEDLETGGSSPFINHADNTEYTQWYNEQIAVIQLLRQMLPSIYCRTMAPAAGFIYRACVDQENILATGDVCLRALPVLCT